MSQQLENKCIVCEKQKGTEQTEKINEIYEHMLLQEQGSAHMEQNYEADKRKYAQFFQILGLVLCATFIVLGW